MVEALIPKSEAVAVLSPSLIIWILIIGTMVLSELVPVMVGG